MARGALMTLCPEAGVGCPISMTYAIMPALRHQPEVAEEWEPRLTSRSYDRRFIPAAEKTARSREWR